MKNSVKRATFASSHVRQYSALARSVAIVFSLTIALSACFSPYAGDDATGTVSISLGGGGGRNAVPWPPDDPDSYILDKIDYVITLTGSGETKRIEAKGGDTIRATVASGWWDVRVEAYYPDKSALYAQGTGRVDVKAGQSNNVRVQMQKAFEDDDPSCDHAWTWTLASAADCTTAGLETEICSHNATHTGATRTVAALGHVFGSAACPNPGCGIKYDYALGNTGPGGGRIFYVADGQAGRPLGFKVEGYTGGTGSFAEYTAYYLEAAPANTSSVRWRGSAANNFIIPEITGITTLASATPTETQLAESIGKGRRDTQIIIAFYADAVANGSHDQAVTDTAANIAVEYRAPAPNNTIDDWFLPSAGEVRLYFTSNVTGVPTGSSYWSSSQRDVNRAWFWVTGDPGSMLSTTLDKGTLYYARAIRAF